MSYFKCSTFFQEIMMIKFVFFCLILNAISTFPQEYTRQDLYDVYPGIGNDWVILDQRNNGSYIIGLYNAAMPRNFLSPNPDDVVTFTLYTRSRPNGTTIKSASELGPNFDQSKPIKFVTHGWMSSGTSETCISIKDGFLKKYDSNVFVMDWSQISGNILYTIAAGQTKEVGQFYSTFINQLVHSGADPKKIHLVGHSLGAHVSGFAARRVDRKIGRVTGLDPAGPGFPGSAGGEHLNETDADFVDVIHTCGDFLGLARPLGHVDFYPNGGTAPQPGCESILQMIESCSHGRSWKYFATSLSSNKTLQAIKCDSLDSAKNGKCFQYETVPMGDATPNSARGYFYLKTSSEPPYAMN